MAEDSIQRILDKVKKEWESKDSEQREKAVVNHLRYQTKKSDYLREAYLSVVEAFKQDGFDEDQIDKISAHVASYLAAQVPSFAKIGGEAVTTIITISEVYLCVYYRREIEQSIQVAE